jgi:hypothetical protein
LLEETVLVKNLAREKEINWKHFRTAYKVAKENKWFCSFEAERDSEELNGIDKWRILHSANAYTNLGNHISTEMRTTLATEINSSKIIDVFTTLSDKSTLIIYVCIRLVNYGVDYHVIFVDLI